MSSIPYRRTMVVPGADTPGAPEPPERGRTGGVGEMLLHPDLMLAYIHDHQRELVTESARYRLLAAARRRRRAGGGRHTASVQRAGGGRADGRLTACPPPAAASAAR